MNGGTGEQTPESTGNSHHLNARDEGATALAARAAARSARNAADAEMLRSDAYLDDVLARLDQAISDLAEVRWSTRGPEVVRAGLRMISSEQARLDAARLGLIAGVDDRDDVVPKAKPKTAGGRSCAPPSAWNDARPPGRPTSPAWSPATTPTWPASVRHMPAGTSVGGTWRSRSACAAASAPPAETN